MAFVPPGTPDNSPPFQRWDSRRDDTASPDRDERDSERDVTTMTHQHSTKTITDQRPMYVKCLSPLLGLSVHWRLEPTDESVGYCRVSLRDKRKPGVAS